MRPRALFQRALAEIKYMGLIKGSRKKTDHRSDKDFERRAHRDKDEKTRKEAQPEGRRDGRLSEGERRRDSTEHRPAERDNWRNSR